MGRPRDLIAASEIPAQGTAAMWSSFTLLASAICSNKSSVAVRLFSPFQNRRKLFGARVF
jgi:hypothetical protein